MYFLHWHPWMENPEAIPTWAKLGQVGQLSWPNSAQCVGPNSPISWPNLGHKETSKADQNKERLLALDGERELFDQLAEILGKAEMQKNGGMWRTRIRGGKEERRALRHTIEDYKILTPDQRRGIRNVPAWFTDRYQRNLVSISGARPREREAQ